MKIAAAMILLYYTIALTALAYLFCFSDPGTLGGLFLFISIAAAVPFTAAVTYYATISD